MSWRDELKDALEERPDYKGMREMQADDDEDDMDESVSGQLRKALYGLQESIRKARWTSGMQDLDEMFEARRDMIRRHGEVPDNVNRKMLRTVQERMAAHLKRKLPRFEIMTTSIPPQGPYAHVTVETGRHSQSYSVSMGAWPASDLSMSASYYVGGYGSASKTARFKCNDSFQEAADKFAMAIRKEDRRFTEAISRNRRR